jgi:hypothetical protein
MIFDTKNMSFIIPNISSTLISIFEHEEIMLIKNWKDIYRMKEKHTIIIEKGLVKSNKNTKN